MIIQPLLIIMGTILLNNNYICNSKLLHKVHLRIIQELKDREMIIIH
jgi:hypothetical protein